MTQIIALSQKTIKNMKTPQIIKLGLYLVWAGSLLTLITTINTIQGQKKAIKTVGIDATPSIILAQRLKDGIAGMDAFVAKELLVPPAQGQDSINGYEERYKVVTERLVDAAHNITYGEKEQKPLQTMQLWLGKYIAKVQQARDFHLQGNTNGVLISYREAIKIIDETLLPNADELDRVNLEALEETYTQEKSYVSESQFLILFSSAVLIGLLIGLQLFLSQRMRRTLNPLLLAATGISIIFLAYTEMTFSSSSEHLKTAKEDAFTSMHALRQARANAYRINANQSRYLLDKALAAKYQNIFDANITRIAKVPDGKTYESLVKEITANNSKKNIIPGFTGFMADELSNVTFEHEKEAALRTLSALGTYVTINQQIRQLEQSGRHQEAIALCIGQKNPGESTWTFDLFRKANDDTFKVNDEEFKKAIQEADHDMSGFQVVAPVLLGAIALSTLFGLMPRIKEYTA